MRFYLHIFKLRKKHKKRIRSFYVTALFSTHLTHSPHDDKLSPTSLLLCPPLPACFRQVLSDSTQAISRRFNVESSIMSLLVSSVWFKPHRETSGRFFLWNYSGRYRNTAIASHVFFFFLWWLSSCNLFLWIHPVSSLNTRRCSFLRLYIHFFFRRFSRLTAHSPHKEPAALCWHLLPSWKPAAVATWKLVTCSS